MIGTQKFVLNCCMFGHSSSNCLNNPEAAKVEVISRKDTNVHVPSHLHFQNDHHPVKPNRPISAKENSFQPGRSQKKE